MNGWMPYLTSRLFWADTARNGPEKSTGWLARQRKHRSRLWRDAILAAQARGSRGNRRAASSAVGGGRFSDRGRLPAVQAPPGAQPQGRVRPAGDTHAHTI